MNFEVLGGAAFKAICATCIPFTLYFATASTLSITVQNFSGVFFIVLIVLIFFCLYSLAGWLVVGLPLHWLITKHLRNNKIYYLIALGTLWLGQFLWSDVRAATITAIVASLQLMLFLHWLRKAQPQN